MNIQEIFHHSPHINLFRGAARFKRFPLIYTNKETTGRKNNDLIWENYDEIKQFNYRASIYFMTLICQITLEERIFKTGKADNNDNINGINGRRISFNCGHHSTASATNKEVIRIAEAMGADFKMCMYAYPIPATGAINNSFIENESISGNAYLTLEHEQTLYDHIVSINDGKSAPLDGQRPGGANLQVRFTEIISLTSLSI